MCNTGKCLYEGTNGQCTVPKVPEDALCYHPKVDALSVDMSFKIMNAMKERECVRQKQIEIHERFMIGHHSNTAMIIEQQHVDYRQKRQAILDEIVEEELRAANVAEKVAAIFDGVLELPWQPLEGDPEEVERLNKPLAFDYAEAEVKIASTLPTKAEIDAAITGRMSKINRIKAVRQLTGWGIKESKHYVEELYE